jgi:hypothetical protein
MTFLEKISALGACERSRAWVEAQPDQSPQALWDTCTEPSWLAWLIARLDRRQGALIACLCVRCVSHLSKQRGKIETSLDQVEAWARGESVDLEEVRASLREGAGPVAFAAYAASCADAFAAAETVSWGTGKRDLCTLIRNAVPTCPL